MILNDSQNVSISFSWASSCTPDCAKSIEKSNSCHLFYRSLVFFLFLFWYSSTTNHDSSFTFDLQCSWYAISPLSRRDHIRRRLTERPNTFIKSVDSNTRLSWPSYEFWLEGSSGSLCVSFITISPSILHWQSRSTTTQSSFFVNGSQVFV